MANTQVVRMLQKQRVKLESKVAQAEKSIAAWKGEMDSLDGAISALGGTRKRTGRNGAKGRKRGTWKPGHPGRPPQWYVEQQKAKGAKQSTRPAKKAGRKRKASPKQLAAMAKAREALAAKRAGAKPAAR